MSMQEAVVIVGGIHYYYNHAGVQKDAYTVDAGHEAAYLQRYWPGHRASELGIVAVRGIMRAFVVREDVVIALIEED
jgi:hypothetical protein